MPKCGPAPITIISCNGWCRQGVTLKFHQISFFYFRMRDQTWENDGFSGLSRRRRPSNSYIYIYLYISDWTSRRVLHASIHHLSRWISTVAIFRCLHLLAQLLFVCLFPLLLLFLFIISPDEVTTPQPAHNRTVSLGPKGSLRRPKLSWER